ncbi:MAG: SLBB domain-containing protein [Treponema sp.]|nr:SLBB domain-containing protein [Treponema sp.]
MKMTLKKIASLFVMTSTLALLPLFAQAEISSNFTSTDNIKRAQMAMSNNEYVVTAGDIYSLVYNGGSFSISVDSTYRVRIANLGIINARGLTVQEFKNKVEALIINNYPTGGVQFFLSNPAQFRVYVKGEVNAAATVETWALVHVSELIAPFYSSYSSKRFVTIISADGVEKQYDLFKAKRYGDFMQDPYLRPGDTIIVNKLDREVSVAGAVMRPGTYELMPGEELRELIFEYGEGFAPGANKDRIMLSRYLGGQPMYSIDFMKETDLHGTTPLACYDRVSVSSMGEISSILYVEGAVSKYYDPVSRSFVASEDDENSYDSTYPGYVADAPSSSARQSIEYQQNMTLSQLVYSHSKMFVNSADLANCYLTRIEVADDGKIEEKKIPVNIDIIMHPVPGEPAPEEVPLKPNDKLTVPFTNYYVTVVGGVGSPGRYPYQPDKYWSYYVNLAMGFDYDQTLFKVVKITDKDGNKLSKKDFIPQEAVIYAQRNSPNSGWFIPLLSTLVAFVTSVVTLAAAIMTFGKTGTN